MKIYTKTGDGGKTSLIGGTRVTKDHPRIEAYGTVDELNSHIGLIADQEIAESIKKTLLTIQDRLFTIGAALAADPEKSRMKLPDLKETDIRLLEQEIDRMDAALPALHAFILPGGHTIVSYCHIARCVCRRAERQVIHLSGENSVDQLVVIYLNRLSDFLFILARMLAKNLGVKEILWQPNL